MGGNLTTLNSEIRLPHTIQILSITLQECTTFELGVVVIGTHEPSCVQMEIYVEIFVDFDGL
jgi:hypothetical protein